MIECIEKYHITAENIYNWDEKGFLIGLARALKRIFTINALKSGKLKGAAQDGCREFISLLACICADGTKLPSTLIYKGESYDLLSSWVEDFKEGDQAYFASTKNGWSCDQLGLQWLQKVFEPHTQEKAGNRRRLLIVDGHSSHVNLKFIEWADSHRIILMILPPHSTHRLQPLDVSLFSPLATAYSNQITQLMMDGYGLVSMSKREFWPMFKVAFETAFTEQNIKSGFAKTGIWPYKPNMVLDKISRPEPPPEPIPLQERTPLTCRAVRQMHKAYKKSPSETRLEKIMHANTRLAAQNSIAQHTITGLIRALQTEKKKRKPRKRLNLVGEEDNGPQIFTPSRVCRARDYADEQEALEQAERDRIESKKASALARRLHKEEQRKERALQASIRKQEVAEKKAKKAAEVQARKDAREAAKQAREAQKSVKHTKKSAPTPNEAPVESAKSLGGPSVKGVLPEPKTVTSRGRAVKLPAKLLD